MTVQQKAHKPTSKVAHQIISEDTRDEAEDASYVLFCMTAALNLPNRVTVELNEQEVQMEMNTGASLSIISKKITWRSGKRITHPYYYPLSN